MSRAGELPPPIPLDSFEMPDGITIVAIPCVSYEQAAAARDAWVRYEQRRAAISPSDPATDAPRNVIITGTPHGVGPVVPEDRVDITIEGIGTLTNTVEAEQLTS